MAGYYGAEDEEEEMLATIRRDHDKAVALEAVQAQHEESGLKALKSKLPFGVSKEIAKHLGNKPDPKLVEAGEKYIDDEDLTSFQQKAIIERAGTAARVAFMKKYGRDPITDRPARFAGTGRHKTKGKRRGKKKTHRRK